MDRMKTRSMSKGMSVDEDIKPDEAHLIERKICKDTQDSQYSHRSTLRSQAERTVRGVTMGIESDLNIKQEPTEKKDFCFCKLNSNLSKP